LRDTDSAARFTLGDAQTLVERATSKNLIAWGTAAQTLPDF
jgi:bifunctional non-homologous end joining protein LigD